MANITAMHPVIKSLAQHVNRAAPEWSWTALHPLCGGGAIRIDTGDDDWPHVEATMKGQHCLEIYLTEPHVGCRRKGWSINITPETEATDAAKQAFTFIAGIMFWIDNRK